VLRLAPASLTRWIVDVGLRERGVNEVFPPSFPPTARGVTRRYRPISLISPTRNRRLGGKKTRRAPSAHRYFRETCICAWLGIWKYIHEPEWVCERERRACLSDAVKAYARHQTAPVVVNFVTTWLPMVERFDYLCGVGARLLGERNALNTATVRKVNNFAVETAARPRSGNIFYSKGMFQRYDEVLRKCGKM